MAKKSDGSKIKVSISGVFKPTDGTKSKGEVYKANTLSLVDAFGEIKLPPEDKKVLSNLKTFLENAKFIETDTGFLIDATVEQKQAMSDLLTTTDGRKLIEPENVGNAVALVEALSRYVESRDKAISIMDEIHSAELAGKDEEIARLENAVAAAKEAKELESAARISETGKKNKYKLLAIAAMAFLLGDVTFTGFGLYKEMADNKALRADYDAFRAEDAQEDAQYEETIKNLQQDNLDKQAQIDLLEEKVNLLATELDEIDEILSETGIDYTVVNGDLSSAVAVVIDGLASGTGPVVTPDDGVSQDDVDKVYDIVADVFKDLGIKPEDLMENGKYSDGALRQALSEIVVEAIENKQTIKDVETRVNSALGKIVKDEILDKDGNPIGFVPYTLGDFQSIEEACEFIEQYCEDALNDIIKELGHAGVTVENFDSITSIIKFMKEDIAGLKAEYERAVEENNNLKTEVQELTNKNNSLEQENAGLKQEVEDLKNKEQEEESSNPGQGSSNQEGTNDTNTPVGDKEVDDSSSTGQGEVGSSNGPTDTEPGV